MTISAASRFASIGADVSVVPIAIITDLLTFPYDPISASSQSTVVQALICFDLVAVVAQFVGLNDTIAAG
jgi:hypothetical protein